MAEDILVAETVPVLSPAGRIVDTFIAPTKTFEAVKVKPMWWVPWLLTSLVGLVFGYVVLHKIGVPALIDGIIAQSSALQERMANASPEQAAAMRNGMTMQFKGMYAWPALALVFGLIVSGIFLATANFVFGGKATYAQMLGVWFYGTLPLLVITILTIITVYAGMASDQFNIKNTVGTNVGYYLQGGSSPKWLVTLMSSFDIVAIWAAVLLTIGVSIVAGIKRGAAATVVFGWWALYVLIQTGIATIGS